MVETGGMYGAIVGYDGTGITAGLDQHIAVYPKELAHEDYNAEDDQGSLWKLLRRLEVVDGSESYNRAITDLWVKLMEESWYIAQDGVLRYDDDGAYVFPDGTEKTITAGDPVFGAHIRNVLSPPHGTVPEDGPDWEQAREIATLVHNVMVHPDGFKAQMEFGKEHLVERTKVRRARVKKKSHWYKVVEAGYGGREVTSLVLGRNWDEETDLALCVYQSHSVNAPAIANRLLVQAWLDQPGEGFPRRLIQLLGTSTYGRWDDDIKYGRYQRTRRAAMDSGLWSQSLFVGSNTIMPEDLP